MKILPDNYFSVDLRSVYIIMHHAYRLLPHRHLYGIMALVSLHVEVAHCVVVNVLMQRPNCEFRKLERLSFNL